MPSGEVLRRGFLFLEIPQMLNEIIDTETATPVLEAATELPANVISLQAFISEFGADLLSAVERDNPPVYTQGAVYAERTSGSI